MNLEEYKKKYPRLNKRLTSLEKRTKIAEIILKLKDNQGMKLLLKELEEVIEKINCVLLNNKLLETQKRELLLTDRERCLWLSEVFNSQQQIIYSTNKYIEKL